MSEAMSVHETVEEPVVESAAEAVSDEQLVAMLVGRARNDGLRLTGEGGLLLSRHGHPPSTAPLRRT